MTINGNLTRYILDGLFIVLIGTFSWVANKADNKVEKHETRIQATEMSVGKIEVKLDYIIKSVDEMKETIKRNRNP